MRKQNLILCAALASMTAVAQNGYQVLVGPDVLEEYQVINMSPNGKWACGVINEGGSTRGWRWDLISGEMIELGARGEQITAMDVSNNGVVVGSFPSSEATPNGVAVETSGYWKEGRWYRLSTGQYEGDEAGGSRVDCISPDGSVMGGIGSLNGMYVPTVWNTATGEVSVYVNNQGGVMDLTNNATTVVGWSTSSSKSNRAPVVWRSTTDSTLLYKVNRSYGPYDVANSISSDGKYVLAYDLIYSIEDLNKGVKQPDTIACPSKYAGFEWFCINNSKTVVGRFFDWENNQLAGIYYNGEAMLLTDYLKQRGVEIPNYELLQTVSVSEDGNTFAVMAFDTLDVPHPMIIQLDVNVTTQAPVALKAVNLEGTGVNKLTWKAPLSGAAGVKSYKIWRNNSEVATVAADGDLLYYDKGVEVGSCEYAVSAVYEGAESEKSVAANVTVVNEKNHAPRNLRALQAGVDDLRFLWNAPIGNAPKLSYVNDDDIFISSGGGNYSFEVAVRFTQADLAHYSGKQITEVSFVPFSKQNSWTVNFYRADAPLMIVPAYSEVIDDSQLQYGVMNSVRLKNPVAIPEGTDLIVGLSVDVTGYGGYQIFGQVFNKCQPGYTDLMRQAGELNFISMYDNYYNQEANYIYAMSNSIGIGLEAEGAGAAVTSYKVYANGTAVGETADATPKFHQSDVAEGSYTYGVSAVYSNGKESEQATVAVDMKKNTAAFRGVDDLKIEMDANGEVVASWTAPVEDDATPITYATDVNTGGMMATEEDMYSFQAATKYDADLLADYDGDYYITDFRFYPTGDADFTFYLKQMEEVVAEVELDRETGYTLNQWNNVKLEEPIKVDAGTTYTLIIDCYDATPNMAPLGADNQRAFAGVSDLYSLDDGETFKSIFDEEGSSKNWMMGLMVRTAQPKALPIENYQVYVNNQLAADKVTATEYKQTVADGSYSMRVDVVYTGNGVGTGTAKFFTFTNAIDLTELDGVTLDINLGEGGNYVKIDSDEVTSLTAYALGGQQVASAKGNTLDISHLQDGIYVLKAVIGNQVVTVKLNLKR